MMFRGLMCDDALVEYHMLGSLDHSVPHESATRHEPTL